MLLEQKNIKIFLALYERFCMVKSINLFDNKAVHYIKLFLYFIKPY